MGHVMIIGSYNMWINCNKQDDDSLYNAFLKCVFRTIQPLSKSYSISFFMAQGTFIDVMHCYVIHHLLQAA